MANSYDVWLVRLQKRDAATAMAVGKLFGVSQAAARHIMANLPRLVVVDVPSGAAEAVARDLRRIGGMAHITRTGDGPNFEGPSVQTSGAPPGRDAKRIRRSDEDEAAREQKSKEDDASSLHWPDDAEPYNWNPHPDRNPPPVPAPVRNSAARVALLLSTSLTVIAAGATAWWFAVGVEIGAAATGTWTTPDAGMAHRPAEADTPAEGGDADADSVAGVDLALAESLAPRLAEAAWEELVQEVAADLDRDPKPLQLAGHAVGVRFEVRARDTLRHFKRLHPGVRAAGASLLRVRRGDTVRPDVVALLPVGDALQVLQLFGTAGAEQGVSNQDVRDWIARLDARQSIFLSGVGAHFVQVRFEVPLRNESLLSDPIFQCPGAARAGGDEEGEVDAQEEANGEAAGSATGGGTVKTLKSLRRGERFTCLFR